MHSQTYTDIIEEKIAEWRQNVKKLEKMSSKITLETKGSLTGKVEELKSAIDEAIEQLYHLNEQETAQNTLEIKERMLNIFSSVDKGFAEHQEKTPFML